MIVTARTALICTTYRKALAAGEDSTAVVGELAAANDVQRPAIWKALRRGGVLPPYAPKSEHGQGRPIGGGVSGYTELRRANMQSRQTRKIQMDETPRVDRDPCPRCGVRRDFGCNHSRIPLGMVL